MKYKKIFIVDDDKDICGIVSSFLRPRHYKVYESHNGAEALEAIKKTRPDLIILDVMMPVMDGFSLLETLRNDPKHSDIPVIMLTVKTQGKYLERGLSLNVNFYLPKPVKLQNMYMFIKLILGDII